MTGRRYGMLLPLPLSLIICRSTGDGTIKSDQIYLALSIVKSERVTNDSKY